MEEITLKCYDRVTDVKGSRTIELDELANKIRSSDEFKLKIEEILQLQQQDMACINLVVQSQIKKIKEALPLFMLASVCSGGRGKAHITDYNYMGMLDIDGISRSEATRIKKLVSTHPSTLMSFLSPRGGLKVIVRIAKNKNIEMDKQNIILFHKAAMEMIISNYSEKFQLENCIDVAHCTNPVGLEYFSYDNDIFYNPNATPFDTRSITLSNMSEEIYPGYNNTLSNNGLILGESSNKDFVQAKEFFYSMTNLPISEAQKQILEEAFNYRDKFANNQRNNLVYKLSLDAKAWNIDKDIVIRFCFEKLGAPDFDYREIKACVYGVYNRGDKAIKPFIPKNLYILTSQYGKGFGGE